MSEEERLKKEVKDLLSGGKLRIDETKKILLDKSTKQFSLKLPKKIAESSGINKESEFKIIFNPKREDFEEAFDSDLLIYEKRKTIT